MSKSAKLASRDTSAIKAARATPWRDVQVMDPETPPASTYFVRVKILTEDGDRWQTFKVRGPANLHLTEQLNELARAQARAFGFTPTGLADNS
jgi:hypothetical protein